MKKQLITAGIFSLALSLLIAACTTRGAVAPTVAIENTSNI